METLHLSFNNILILPDSFRLDKLKTLHLNSNVIQILPLGFLSHLPFLIDLNLSNNRLTSLEGSGLELNTKLQILDVSSNLLKSLPDCLSTCSQLKILKASSNQITKLGWPPSLLSSTRLSGVYLEKNPISRNEFMEVKGYEVYAERRKGRVDQFLF